MKKYLLSVILITFAHIGFSQITVSWPIERAVFQRSNFGSANITIAGQCTVAPFPSNWQLQYRIRSLTKEGFDQNYYNTWTNIPTLGTGKTFHVTTSVTTGWYKLYVRILDNGNQISIYERKFGVGEVFIVAGQSNAVGEGSMGALTEPDYDCVIASAQTSVNKCSNNLPVFPVLYSLGNSSSSNISPNGSMPWAYKRLGNLIATKEPGKVVPTLFFNTGFSGSSSNNWNDSANNPNAMVINTCSFGNNGNANSLGEPYRTFRNSLNYYGSLFGTRGVIWHQGEADTREIYTMGSSADGTTYFNNMKNVVEKSRLHFSNDLAWAISNVSMYSDFVFGSPNRNIYTSKDKVVSGQQLLRNNWSNGLGKIAPGALGSDEIIDWYFSPNAQGNNNGPVTTSTTLLPDVNRQSDRQHFKKEGLEKLADNYFLYFGNSGGNDKMFSQSTVAANPLIPVTITQVGVSKKIELNFAAIGKSSSDFSCYQWTQGNDYTNATYPPSNCVGNYSPLIVSGNGFWRCYMQDNKGNVYTTQRFFIDTNPNFRVRAEEPVLSKMYPNPTLPEFENTIEFYVDEPTNVTLEVVDHTGSVLETLADSYHAAGTFKYPFTLKKQAMFGIEKFYYRVRIGEQVSTKQIVLK